MKLGDKIKQLRVLKGKTQTDMAKELGIQQHGLSEWEKGTHKPTLKSLKKLADYFNIDLQQLTKLL